MEYNLNPPAIGPSLYDPRGNQHLSRDHPTAPGYWQGDARDGMTASECHEQTTSPDGSVSRDEAGLTPASAERGTEDAPSGDTTSDTRDGSRAVPGPDRSGRPRPEPPRTPMRTRKPLVQIGSLNIRGCGNPRRVEKHKIAEATRWMRANKVGVMGLQETYNCTANFAEAERANGKVWAFPNPGDTHSAGTGFLIHREGFTADFKRDDFTHKVLIEGRLDTLTWRWGDEDFTIANLYTPNDERVAVTFFEKIIDLLRPIRPNVVLGDWNHVESSSDRLPPRGPGSSVKEILRDVRVKLDLNDTWRDDNPNTKDFTWEATHPNADGSTSRSRLDRILLSSDTEDRSTEHVIDVSLTISDHYPVRVKIIDSESPEIGEPRWRMNLEDLDDNLAMEQCREVLAKCEKTMARSQDPMPRWLAAKESIREVLKSRQLMRRRERSVHLEALKEQRKKLSKRKDFAVNTGLQHEEGLLRERIANISRAKLDRAAESSAARFAEKGESVNKYWFSIGKSIRESSIIRTLTDDDDGATSDTTEMAEIARAHHERLQAAPAMTSEREEAIKRMTQTTNGKRFTSEAKAELKERLTEKDAEEAIRSAQCGKAPGKDGIPYEFNKYWVERHRKAEPGDSKKTPNIAAMLATVWNSIGDGVEPPKAYTEGLMFLLYKKKRRDRVENYRPITLLGCDYKLQTKALTTKLGRHVNNVIHPDQAGFVPGRDILDHVKLARCVKEHCDTIERDGCLVALDQEKAYDRIDHAYLWQIMRAFGLPLRFICTVQTLYQNAETSVLVNQAESAPFKVARGVRQGDPLSCLLFNLAIEPMAESIRRSELKGIKVPEVIERLVVRLFADDTQIYLSKNDKWSVVKRVTDDWCLASTAKFNEGKTEFLPMGRAQYRKGVCESKKLRPTSTRSIENLPSGARFVEDGQPLRILGGIVGHKVCEKEVWDPVTSKIEQMAQKWANRRMTMKGRRLIISFIVQSRAQYLMATNDPPPETVARIEKATHKVMWAGKKRGLTTMEIVQKPVTEGGFGVPSFKLRARAARLMTAKKWAASAGQRPLWADVMDEMVRVASKRADDPRVTSILHQTWKETSGKTSSLPRDVQAMLKETRRYNLRIEARKFASLAKEEAPVWLSNAADLTLKEENSAAMRHLRKFHRVQNMGDLKRLTQANREGCKKHLQCIKAIETLAVRTDPRLNIRFTTPCLEGANAPDSLDHTSRRSKKAREDAQANRPILLDPTVTHHGTLNEALRLFGKPPPARTWPAFKVGPVGMDVDHAEVWTDGSATGFGTSHERVGFGVWCEPLHIELASRLYSPPATNNRAELAAVAWTLENIPKHMPVLIHTDSQYVIQGIYSTKQTWEDRGWLGVENADLWKRTCYLLQSRTSETKIAKVKAHSGILGNEKADQLAKLGAESEEEYLPSMEVPTNWQLNGARLGSLTHPTAYEWIRHTESKDKDTDAPRNLHRVKDCLVLDHGIRVEDAKIWLSLRRPYIRREISDFLWTMIHGRTRCGTMFQGWGPDWEHLQYCDNCGDLETAEHILSGCPAAVWRKRLWREASNLMSKSGLIPSAMCREPHFAEIMGAGLVKIALPSGTRLWATLVTETAFSIWKLRNRARFDEIQISQKMAIDLWRSALEKRAKTDLAATKLKGPKTDLGDKRNREIACAWGRLVSVKGGIINWYPADYG